jgi:hypothetical protein
MAVVCVPITNNESGPVAVLKITTTPVFEAGEWDR